MIRGVPGPGGRRSRPRCNAGFGGAVPAGAPVDPITAQVYELADDGHDPVAIAQTLDDQIGTVELILPLREDA